MNIEEVGVKEEWREVVIRVHWQISQFMNL